LIFNVINLIGLLYTKPTYSTTYIDNHYYLYRDYWEIDENTIKIAKRNYLFEREISTFNYFKVIREETDYQNMIEEHAGSNNDKTNYDSLNNIANEKADKMFERYR
jgi:hypothetical protein